MYIRGVDFSRANVIVGTDAEAPVPSSGGAGQLQARDVVAARVIAATGGEATLDINGQRVVVQTHVSLNAGDKLFVRVQENTGGSIRLSVLASAPEGGTAPKLPDSALDDLLRELGMPADDRTRLAARATLSRDGMIDRPAVQRLVQDMRQLPEVTAKEAGAAALLQKANVPVTPQSVALMTARVDPEAPPALAARLDALRPGLEALARQGGRTAALAAEIGAAIKGLPLDDRGGAERVAVALRDWIDKLTPANAKRASGPEPRASGPEPTANPARTGSAPAATSPAGPSAPPAPQSDMGGASLLPDRLSGAALKQAAHPAQATPGGKPAQAPEARVQNAATGSPDPHAAEAADQELMRVRGVHASPHFSARVGINNVALPASTAPDLASQLERLGKSLGGEHQGLKQLIGEAVAEVRYLQLSNGPPQTGAGPTAVAPEFLIPLLLPQLTGREGDAQVQVYQQPRKPGEPIDPDNLNLQVVLDTEHLQTVQADLSIKDGVVSVTLGVTDPDDRAFLEAHVEELKNAIARQGFETGRFGARQAKGLPPRTRQAEGLDEVVRFDQRI